jgi:hypothetical protein
MTLAHCPRPNRAFNRTRRYAASCSAASVAAAGYLDR